jgi:hypothetical protein
MAFGPDHYTRDWDLLRGVCSEWTEIRRRFRLGSKATREQIEAVWDQIFNADKAAWPGIRRIFHELMRDEALARHLEKCYWQELEPWQRRGYTFEELLPVVLYRLCWIVVRNACAWLAYRDTTEHWARFWNTDSLTGELGRAIDDMWKSEGPRDEPLPDNLPSPPTKPGQDPE